MCLSNFKLFLGTFWVEHYVRQYRAIAHYEMCRGTSHNVLRNIAKCVMEHCRLYQGTLHDVPRNIINWLPRLYSTYHLNTLHHHITRWLNSVSISSLESPYSILPYHHGDPGIESILISESNKDSRPRDGDSVFDRNKLMLIYFSEVDCNYSRKSVKFDLQRERVRTRSWKQSYPVDISW